MPFSITEVIYNNTIININAVLLIYSHYAFYWVISLQ